MSDSSYARFEVFPGADGQFYWRLRAINGEIVAQSEGYERKADAKRACHAVVDAVTAVNLQTSPHMQIVELESADETVTLGEHESGVVDGEHAQPPAPGEPGGPPADLNPPEPPAAPAETPPVEDGDQADQDADGGGEPPAAPPAE